MSIVYFISDAHLGLNDPSTEKIKENQIVTFLKSIQKRADRLFILGDLFDAWIEYRTVIPKGFHRTLAALHDLHDNGTEIHFLVGNHDCWTRDYFSSEIGMIIHHQPFYITIDGKKIFLHHGDGLCPNDKGYRILKKIVRNPFAVWLFSWLHPDIGLKIARSSSKKSRYHSEKKHYGEEDGMLKYATSKINEGYDYVIMGHRHLPAQTIIQNGKYINLGDWITHRTYAIMENGELKLEQWK